MSQQFPALSDQLISFIEKQKIFFVGTATADSRVNISPKGMDSLRVTSNNKVVWLNLTGSGNETSAHVQIMPRMTIMFTAFEGKPLILRLYGNAKVIHKNDSQWDVLYSLFKPTMGARQIFELDIDLVQTSCGMSVPLLDYVEDRKLLSKWAEAKGADAIKEYWLDKNKQSIDGIATNIEVKNH
ncbi:MAG: pyridoxamine 5'-phosphate oxidase family protein [Gammaproteobacteria bacterium]|nr:pyridoxamine 5'-phosphate oxidase family protein [Gammaproteobacteria bacterium]